MIAPKQMWRPPKPAPSQKSFQPAGVNNANAPATRKHPPITGTTGTENAPPVMTPAPYNISQTPGINATRPARHSTSVRAAPTIRGGTKLKTNLRVGADHRGSPAASALRHMAGMPKATASAPSASHVPSHVRGEVCHEAMTRSEEHTSELQSRFGISYAVFCLKK